MEHRTMIIGGSKCISTQALVAKGISQVLTKKIIIIIKPLFFLTVGETRILVISMPRARTHTAWELIFMSDDFLPNKDNLRSARF